MKNQLAGTIKTMKEKGLYNYIKTVESEQGAYLLVDGKKYLNLCSNNYLGLAAHPRLKKAAQEAIEKFGVGTASVRSLIGTNSLHLELEKELASFKKAEGAIVVTSGYLANLAAIQTLLGKDDIVISDELNHASIIDAVRLAQVTNKFIYKHGDVKNLRSQIAKINALKNEKTPDGANRQVLIVTDGVFSMDGDIAPLPELVAVARDLGAYLMVDDAHGEGVLGKNGRGIVDHFHLHGQVDIEVGTLSKAFGVLGGFITGKKSLVEYYRQRARQFLFTNALSIPDTAALIAGVRMMGESDRLLKKLWSNTEFLKESLKKAGFDIGQSVTPLTPVMVGDENKAKEFAAFLFQEGVMVSAIKYPMVALGKARLRLIPSAAHTKKDLRYGVEKISLIGKKLGLI
ncbi:glycine C-acetyltransferase [Candidatus Roizmanbacteria bacterium]|nr:glycine C-acetyltransferase [Candidatus Roizmanbacteria bacterium]